MAQILVNVVSRLHETMPLLQVRFNPAAAGYRLRIETANGRVQTQTVSNVAGQLYTETTSTGAFNLTEFGRLNALQQPFLDLLAVSTAVDITITWT